MEIILNEFNTSLINKIESTLYSHKNIDEITLNFNKIKWATPTPILVIGSIIKNFIYYRDSNELTTKIIDLDSNNQTLNYLKYVGFFNFAGISKGNKIGGNSVKFRYIPIQKITFEDLESL